MSKIPYNHKAIEKKWRDKWEENPVNVQFDENGKKKEKYYCLDMFPYPSGNGLHVGHWRGYVISDVWSRYKLQQGYYIIHPMGWDAFGLPAENYAIKMGVHPEISTAANIKNGGRTPIAGMVHSITLVLILVVLMPYAALIPMPCIAAILFMVAYNMCGWRTFVGLCKSAPKSDIIVLVLTFALTVIFDLVVAIEVGILLAAILFMKRMSDVTEVEGWKYLDEEDDPDSIALRAVPDHTLVYEVSGPMFFGAADKILKISVKEDTQFLIIRMRSVNAIDATAMHYLEQLYESFHAKGIQIILSHVNEQPRSVMDKAGFTEKIGEENFCIHIDEALERAHILADVQDRLDTKAF